MKLVQPLNPRATHENTLVRRSRWVVTRTRTPGCHGARRQNDRVPVAVIRSTSWSGSCSREQLPSGLRARTARGVTVALKLPSASANCPVRPTTSPVWWVVIVATQLCGLTEGCGSPRAVLLRCMLPRAKTRSSRVTRSSPPGWFSTSTIRPTPAYDHVAWLPELRCRPGTGT
jgi:hypothetical protein